MLRTHADVRPPPEQSAMAIMVFRKIVREDFTVETVNGMYVRAASSICGDADGLLDHAMVVDEHRTCALEQSERFVGDVRKAQRIGGTADYDCREQQAENEAALKLSY